VPNFMPIGSHDRNLSASASGVFDILVLYKLDYYYYYNNKQAISVNVSKFAETAKCH